MMKRRIKLTYRVVSALVVVGGLWLWSRASPNVSSAEYMRRFNALSMEGVDPATNGWGTVLSLEARVEAADGSLRDRFDREIPDADERQRAQIWSWWGVDDPDAPELAVDIIRREIERLETTGFFEASGELRAVDRAAVELPVGDFDYLVFNEILDRIAPLRHVVSIELARFHFAVERGDAETAERAIATCLAAARICAQQPLSFMRQYGDVNLGTMGDFIGERAEEACEIPGLADSLDAMLRDAENLPGAERWISGERLQALAVMSSLQERIPVIMLIWGAVRDEYASINSVYDLALELSARPRAERLARAAELDTAISRAERTPAGLVMTGPYSVIEGEDALRARLRAARIALALEAFHLAHGVYPPTLGSLAPDFIDAVPNDPLAPDGSFRFEATESGTDYMLYTVGADGQDDGGREMVGNYRWDVLEDRRKSGFDFVFHAPE